LRNTIASGVVPQISAILGPCAGGAVYSPAITDFVFMAKNTSYMFVTGPEVIRTVTHEDVTMERLGGASTHSQVSGVAHFACEDDVDTLGSIRRLVGFLPSNNAADPPVRPTQDSPDREDGALDALVPEDPNKPYDIKELLRSVADEGEFFEVHAHFVSPAGPWEWWPTNRRTSLACLTSTPPSKGRASCGSATRSTSPS
jgi:propionyl-CoA carboxylase beta chain